MRLIKLALLSLKSRKLLLSFSVFAMACSLALVLSLQSIRKSAQEGFTQTISQVDLLVGARGGSLQLLLFSVFNVGTASNNVSLASYEYWKKHPSVFWTIPYSLGDSFQGFRVVGTDQNFFEHYRFRGDQSVQFIKGNPFKGVQEVVLGSRVAHELKLKLEDSVTITHGVTKGAGVIHHEDRPFRVVGILKPTSTALDQAVYISLESMELIHLPEGEILSEEKLKGQIQSITSFFLRTKNRVESLKLQREISEYKEEPLMAVIPGVALSELWRNLSYFEKALEIMVLMVGLFGLLIVTLLINATLETRRREISLFRSLGAQPITITGLILIESFFLALLGGLLGLGLHRVLLLFLSPVLQSEFGMHFQLTLVTGMDMVFIGSLILIALLASLPPAWLAQKRALKDGLVPKF